MVRMGLKLDLQISIPTLLLHASSSYQLRQLIRLNLMCLITTKHKSKKNFYWRQVSCLKWETENASVVMQFVKVTSKISKVHGNSQTIVIIGVQVTNSGLEQGKNPSRDL